MKILHVFPYLFEAGGIPHQTRCLITAEARMGHHVSTISLNGEFLESFKIANAPVNIIGVRTLWEGGFVLWDFLTTVKPDVVHFTGTWIPVYQFWGRIVWWARVPYVVSVHGNLSPHGMKVRYGGKKCYFYHVWLKWFWQRYLDIPFLKKSAGVHAHSKYEEDLIKSAGIQKSFIAPVGVDRKWNTQKASLPRTLHKPITFLHLGRLDIYHKGIDLVFASIKLLAKGDFTQKCKFIFVGPTVNDSIEKLRRFALQFDKDFIEIREAVAGQEKEQVWKKADFFLNIYRFAGMALSPCEALAHGIPLISSRESNFGDWTCQEKIGFVTRLDSTKLSELFEFLLNITSEEYKILSQNALAFASSFSWERAGMDVLKGYKLALTPETVTCGTV